VILQRGWLIEGRLRQKAFPSPGKVRSNGLGGLGISLAAHHPSCGGQLGLGLRARPTPRSEKPLPDVGARTPRFKDRPRSLRLIRRPPSQRP